MTAIPTNRRDRIAALAYDYAAEPKAHRELAICATMTSS